MGCGVYINIKKNDDIPSVSGIYCLLNRKNNKRYIGSSVNIHKRILEHKRSIKKGSHYNSYLQSAFDINIFILEIIEKCEITHLADSESQWIKFYETTNKKFGYNQCDVTETRRNIVSEESKRKISSSLMKNFYQSAQQILMIDKNSNEIVQLFNSLKEASVYLIENNFSKGKEQMIRCKIRESVQDKKISTGNNRIANRMSAFGFKWRYINVM